MISNRKKTDILCKHCLTFLKAIKIRIGDLSICLRKRTGFVNCIRGFRFEQKG